MGIDEFKTITNVGEGTYSEKRSKFLAFSHHVESEDDIRELLAFYRKKYFDARHVCYAYMLGAERKILDLMMTESQAAQQVSQSLGKLTVVD